jgi:hypothetical protein
MEHGGINVHKNQSQICLFTEAGEVLHQRTQTQRERFVAVFAERPKARILLEASTESEWVTQCPPSPAALPAPPLAGPTLPHPAARVQPQRWPRCAALALGPVRSALHTSGHTRKNSRFSTQDEHLVLLGLEALTEAPNLRYATRSI